MSHAPGAEGGLQRASQLNAYSDSSWKLAFLLQLGVGSTILVDGKDGVALCAGLTRLSYRAIPLSQAMIEHIQHADALVVLPGGASSTKLVERVVARMRADAQILVFLLHRWSVYAGVRTGMRNLLSRESRTIRLAVSSTRSLQRAEPQVWLPLPKHAVPEEFVSASEPEEIAASLACTPHKAKARARWHDSFGVYGSPAAAGVGALACALEDALRLQGLHCTLRVTRFDLRNRGALVLFVVDKANERAYVCRVVRGEMSEHLQRHWHLQAEVRRALTSHPMRSRIPEEIASVRLGEHMCWIETRSPGTVSWRLPSQLRAALDDQIVEFIAELAAVTSVVRPVSHADLEDEAHLWQEQIGTKLTEESAQLLRAAFDALRERFIGCSATFGWVHGDYGYGNALATPSTGEISSVIDWETASPRSFVGIDLFNFLLQRARTTENVSLSEATARLVEKINLGAFGLDNPVGGYLTRFLPDRISQLRVLVLTLCRWLRREHRYGMRVPSNAADLRDALSQALNATVD